VAFKPLIKYHFSIFFILIYLFYLLFLSNLSSSIIKIK
jgi:hypothetical protein